MDIVNYQPQEHFEAKRGGAESWQDVEGRMKFALEQTLEQHAGKRIAIVSHAGPLAYLNRALTDTKLEKIDDCLKNVEL